MKEEKKNIWEHEGDWYIQPNEGLWWNCSTEEAAETLLKLLNEKNILLNQDAAITQTKAEIRDIIPSTFYAGLELEERLKMLVNHWQRAIEVNHQLQEKTDGIVDKIEEMIDQQKELSKIFDTEEWWYSQRTGEPFSNKVTRALTELLTFIKEK